MKSTLSLPALTIILLAAIACHHCEAAAMGEIEAEMKFPHPIPNPSDISDDIKEAVPEVRGCIRSGYDCGFGDRHKRCCSGNCRRSGWTRGRLVCD